MDELKKIIAENRELFDSALPTEGHMDRFYDKLNAQSEPQIKKIDFSWVSILKVASVSILIVLSGLYVKDRLFTLVPEVPFELANQEFVETQQYYVQQVDQKIGAIGLMDNALSTEQREILTLEMSNMDNMYKKLQSDLNTMPNDPRIMQAMLQHYQMKMEILNRIIIDLNNVQQLNIRSHESIEL